MLEVLLAGVTVGCIVIVEALVWHSRAAPSVRWASLLFGLDVTLYALGSAGLLTPMVSTAPWLKIPIAAFVCGGTGYYGFLVRSIFADQPVTWRQALPLVALMGCGMAVLATQGLSRALLLTGYLVICAAELIRSVKLMLNGWPGDLVEARKRLRRPGVILTIALTLAIALDLAAGSATRIGWLPSWMTTQREAGIALLAVAVAVQALSLRVYRAQPAETAEDSDDRLLMDVEKLMQDGGWRQEGLTLAALASRIAAPEYRVRRVILNRLGHRNFPAFVNAYRLAEARERLMHSTHDTVASIAFEVGFGSLSAFNRAFRDATGESPVQWRKKLRDSSNPATI